MNMGINKQPFHHRVDGLLFTSTSGLNEKDFIKILQAGAKSKVMKKFGLLP
jgi:hypothetical protein